MRHRFLVGAAVAAATLAAWAQEPVAEPRYVVEPCCDLCPQASSRAAYNTRYLESFATLIQGKDGWLFRSDDLRSTFGPDDSGYQQLKRLHSALKRRGTDLVVIYQPTRALMHADKLPKSARTGYNADLARFSYSVTLKRFREAGLIVPDLTQLLREPAEPPYYFRGDNHWTPYGAQRAARLVADTIRQLPVYGRLPKGQFTTERMGQMAKQGSLYKAAAMICGSGYAEQYVDRFATTSGNGGDLFGEQQIPPVTFVGTSNGNSDYNFAGFLSEYLGVDVLNAAVHGLGHGALLQYLPSPEFQRAPPKVLIWELQPNHNLSQRNFWRQAVPLVQNGCEGRAILSNRVEMKGARSEVLFNGGGKVLPLHSRNHLIDLRFDDASVREIEAVIWYTNGSKETVDLKYSPYLEAAGRFVVELRDDPGWADRTFMSLDLRHPTTLKTAVGVTAKLCAREGAPGRPSQQAATKP
jgi:alginate biosynthesis protein AlgX